MYNLDAYGYNTGALMDTVRRHKWIQYGGAMDPVRVTLWIYLCTWKLVGNGDTCGYRAGAAYGSSTGARIDPVRRQVWIQ